MNKSPKKMNKTAKKAKKAPTLKNKKTVRKAPKLTEVSKQVMSKKAKARESKKSQERREEETLSEEQKFRESWFEMLTKIEDYKDLRIEQLAFGIFLASMPKDRGTQGDFAKAWGVSETTLSAWKMNPKIRKLRIDTMKLFYVDKTPVVIDTLYEAATKTDFNGKYNTPAMKLWLQYVEDYREKSALDVGGEGIAIHFGGGKSPFMTGDDPDSQKKLEQNKDPKNIKMKSVESPEPPDPKKEKRPTA